MLASGVVSFLAKGNIETKNADLKTTKATLDTTTSTLKKREGELKTVQEEVTAKTAALEEEKATGVKLKQDAEAAVAAANAAKAELETKSNDLAALQKVIEDLKGKTTGGMDPEQVKQEIAKMQSDLQEAQTKLAEQQQLVLTATAKQKEAESKFNEQQAEIRRYKDRATKAGLSGRIMAVNPGWNFVVLSVGDRQGAAVGGTMLVTRGGEAIAKARISSVEPSTSIADIIPGSVREGVTVQPGDNVIYEGERK
jgi:SMC interacting uncharacterized protein involved in chromosome segregation